MMERTIVFQSFRVENVPPAIDRCMQSVRDWAEGAGFDYRFYDDDFLRKVPAWLTEATDIVLLIADYARVMTALELHSQGYDRAIWMDADLAVHDFSKMVLPHNDGFGFSREWWLAKPDDQFKLQRRVNNCCCFFDRGDPFAPFYLQAMERRLHQRGKKITGLEFSTRPLTNMQKDLPIPLVQSVATLSPLAVHLILEGNKLAVEQQMKAYSGPNAAVHLAMSLTEKNADKLLDMAFAREWPFDGSF